MSHPIPLLIADLILGKKCPAGFSHRIIPSPHTSPRMYPPLTKRQKNELVLINHSWIFPTLQWGLGWGSIFQKNRGLNFPSKKEPLRECNLLLLFIFVFVNLRNIAM